MSDLLCCRCGKSATWLRRTQFSEEKNPFCTIHAVVEDGFGDEDPSNFLWEQVQPEDVAPNREQEPAASERLAAEVHRMSPEEIATFYRYSAEELRRQAFEARAAADVSRTVLLEEAARAADAQAELFVYLRNRTV